jgi:hypothetical protein
VLHYEIAYTVVSWLLGRLHPVTTTTKGYLVLIIDIALGLMVSLDSDNTSLLALVDQDTLNIGSITIGSRY